MNNPFQYSNTNKRYYAFDYYLKNRYSSKVFKVPLNASFSCPNRDGTVGYGGCYFCSVDGGGENGPKKEKDILEQFDEMKEILHKKWPIAKYIAYFQAYSNTYASIKQLKEKFEPFIYKEDVVALFIATRADCLGEEVIDYLSTLSNKIDLWVEIGLQTIHDSTGENFNRGYGYQVFLKALENLRKHKISVCVHLINGLPGEDEKMMLETAKKIGSLDIQGVKFHNLNIVKNSVWGKSYLNNPFSLISKEQYIDIVIKQLEYLRDDIVIMRLNSDPIEKDLLAPSWNNNKVQILNDIDKEMAKRNTYQGLKYNKKEDK